jgi:hypothetical protein
MVRSYRPGNAGTLEKGDPRWVQDVLPVTMRLCLTIATSNAGYLDGMDAAQTIADIQGLERIFRNAGIANLAPFVSLELAQ